MNYRADIDGLRAVAVLSVLFYHLDLGPFAGGFVGVDVFFVISGFLITAIVQREVDAGSFTYSGFYQRRIRRLFPALFVVLAATFVAGAFILLPSDLSLLGGTTVATIFYLSNIFLWRHSGYFDGPAELNPLLHTWSLAVEEQFYIVFPTVLVLLARHLRARLAAAVAVLGLASFALCVLTQPRFPTGVFFLAPFRAWELLAGSVLALGTIPPLPRRWQRELVSLASLSLLAYSVLRIEAGPAFPGWIAALPVVATAALIHSGTSGDSLVRRFLSLRPLVFVGLISYSLYLWHWPLVVFAKYVRGLEPLGDLRWLLTAVSIVLASLSLRFVERPFRSRVLLAVPRRLFATAGVASVAFASLGAVVFATGGLAARFEREVVALDQERSPEIPLVECMGHRIEAGGLEERCRLGDPDAPISVLLWGDSHALAWVPALDGALRSNRLAGLFAGTSACPPLFGVANPASPRCLARNRDVERLLAERSELELVILVAAWFGYSSDAGRYRLQDLEGRSGNSVVFPKALRDTLAFLTDAGKQAWVIGPTPGAPSFLPLRMALLKVFGGRPLEPVAAASFAERRRAFAEAVEQLPAGLSVHVTDPGPWLCDSDACRFEADGLPLYRDGGHLNVRGASYLQPFVSVALGGLAERNGRIGSVEPDRGPSP